MKFEKILAFTLMIHIFLTIYFIVEVCQKEETKRVKIICESYDKTVEGLLTWQDEEKRK